ncbi:uncharacterized protein LOC121877330 [Homarus americanus]|uniref:Uncharacterized protein n=1 Tax=Homarus americanus TaxID=6706 RepID=A0A8J5JJT6_HOMAM|nr:uncharacterized protein LOC121877330 [Homarus americanus]KAG7159492.1 hypothetical protein Hamer_G004122 [Homarus americanus]
MSPGKWWCVAAVVWIMWMMMYHRLAFTTTWRPWHHLASNITWTLQHHLPPKQTFTRSNTSHATFTKECYTYSGVTARNTCCKLHDYRDGLDLLNCIKSSYVDHVLHQRQNMSEVAELSWFSMISQAKERVNADSVHHSTEGVHWALVGDSHVRYITDVIIRRLATTGLQYTERSFEGVWHEVYKLLNLMRMSVYTEDLEVRHMVVPFYLTWYRDTFLQRLPELIRQWEAGEQLKPTLLILDCGLHWMVRSHKISMELGEEAAAVPYKEQLRSLAPQLTRLAATTTIIFKLLDDIPAVHGSHSDKNWLTLKNLQLYNSIVRESLEGTGVILWDSTLPLSQAYTSECVLRPKSLFPSYSWKCFDENHVGYIVVEQYADMILNDVCNKYMNLKPEYCP